MRAVMRAKVERHQKSRRWAVLGRTRCQVCRLKWPCLAYQRARRALDGQSSTVDWVAMGTEPRIAVAPFADVRTAVPVRRGFAVTLLREPGPTATVPLIPTPPNDLGALSQQVD